MKKFKYILIILIIFFGFTYFVKADYTDDDIWSNENFDSLTFITDNDHFFNKAGNNLISTDKSYNGTKSLRLKSSDGTNAGIYLNGYTSGGVEQHEMLQYNTFRFYVDDLADDDNFMGQVRYMTCDDSSCSYAGTIGFWATSSEVMITFGSSTGAQITDYDIARVDIDVWNLMYIDFDNVNRIFTLKVNNESVGSYNLAISSKPLLRQIRFFGLDSGDTGLMYIDDLQFYEEDPYFSWTNEWFELSETYPDVSVPLTTICFIDENCPIEYWFNNLAIGSDLYIVTDLNNPYIGYEATSTTINYNYEYRDFIYLDSVSVATVTPYLIIIDSSIGQINQGSNKVVWVDKNDYLPDMSFFNDPCYGIATSSGDFWDDFRYGFECGGARLGAYLFRPSTSSMEAITKEFENTQDNFPINIMNNVKQTLQNSETSTTSLQLFPFLGATGTPFGYLVDQDLIENATMYGVFSYIRTFLISIIYGFTFLYFVFRIMAISRKQPKE